MLLPYITFFFLVLGISSSSDTIAMHQNISYGQAIVSANAIFELGFFTLGSSKNRYLGIWYKNTSPQTVAWVANRETLLMDTSGAVKLDNRGNLTLVNGSGKVMWSSNSSASGTDINLVAQLLDTGNLVIKNGNEIVIWQSFDYPGDTCIPGMKLGKNFITGRETNQTSWRSTDDPSPDYCDIYGVCGPYGSCNTATSPNCGCLRGFELKNSDDTSPECRRSTALHCGPGEGFQKFSSMKLPDTENAVYRSNMSLSDCAVACKNNCSCTAYANPNITPGGVGCLLWFGALIDVRVFQQNGQDLYVM
ncbi:putative S-locus glycoprotein [Helianthus annuus]|nr:putative S-locus glycoprotein [Helianthus annuus]